MADVITAADETMIELFSGLSPGSSPSWSASSGKKEPIRPPKGRPWSLGFDDRNRNDSKAFGESGRSLLERCDRDGTRVRVDVLQGSPARRLYERHGFTFESEDSIDVFMVREPRPLP